MHVASGQQFPFARLEPASSRVALASWAMSVSTRVVGDGGRMSAAGAAVAMATQRSSAAAQDRQQHLLVLPVHPPAAAFNEKTVQHSEQCRPSPAEAGCSTVLVCSRGRKREGIKRAGGRA